MLRSSVLAAIVLVAFTAVPAATAEFKIDKAAIVNGRLVVSGRTAMPSQVVEFAATGDKTVSLRSRQFTLTLLHHPPTCILRLRADGVDQEGYVVSGCAQRGQDGKDGKPGKDGRDAVVYGSMPGDGAAFQCWSSDLIGIWFIKDYPAPNARTIAHIAPDLAAGGKRLNLTEPDNPPKAAKAGDPKLARPAEFDGEKLYVLDRETKSRNGVRGDVAPDCRSIVWNSAGTGILGTWQR